jgi:predicted nucleic acid-binding protein
VAAAGRARRLDDDGRRRSIDTLERLWSRLDRIDLGEPLAFRAGELAVLCALRGYDAIHLASAEAILDEGDVMVVSDTRLAEAAASIGIEALIPAEG